MTTCVHKLCSSRNSEQCDCNRYAVNKLHLDGHEHIGGFNCGKVVQLYKNLETGKFMLTDGEKVCKYSDMNGVKDALKDEIKWEDK